MYSPAATWPKVAHTIPPKISEIAIQIPLQMPASRSDTSCASRWKNSRSTASIARMKAMTATHAHHSTVLCEVMLASSRERLDDVLGDQPDLVDVGRQRVQHHVLDADVDARLYLRLDLVDGAGHVHLFH